MRDLHHLTEAWHRRLVERYGGVLHLMRRLEGVLGAHSSLMRRGLRVECFELEQDFECHLFWLGGLVERDPGMYLTEDGALYGLTDQGKTVDLSND